MVPVKEMVNRESTTTVTATHLNILTLFVHQHYFHKKVLGMRRDGPLADVFHQLTELHR